ncbi:MAG: energy transducer TonB [Terracidiphilus sp.]|nr:energy transducer TonB [Terracidiphilus sp.]
MLRFWPVASLVLFCTIVAPAQQKTPINVAPLSSDQWAAHHVTPPKLTYGELLDYPVEAEFQQMDGLCLLSMIVDIQGNPQDIRIIHCTDPSFEGTSLNAATHARFKPATTDDEKPVPVKLRFMHQYHFIEYSLSLHMLIDWPVVPDKRLALDPHMSKSETNHAFSRPIHYGFVPQQDGPAAPDSDGVYTQTRNVTGPRVTKFSDEGYGRLAFGREGESDCDVMLTISAKGKASDPTVIHCESPELEKVALASLLRSGYKPGFVRGKEVPMRGLIRLNYGDTESATSSHSNPLVTDSN